MSGDSTATQTFVEWFTRHGGAFRSDIVKVGEDVQGMGRGLVAVADIKVCSVMGDERY